MPKALSPGPTPAVGCEDSGQARAEWPDVAALVLAWQAQHGRRGLPWQGLRDPYRVWLSEIMLQQTQVSTVLHYFPRFVERFPDVQSLAQADEDEVLGLWSGLGYYSRARNLHRCAQQVVQQHGGRFPDSASGLQTLPGIGPSTAAAVAAFCYGERVAIFDGNVRRVLARVLACADDMSVARHAQALWAQATALLPRQDAWHNMPRYTQGLMDLGATVCTARQPDCAACPLAAACQARQQGRPTAFPVKSRKLKRSAEALWLLWLQDAQGRSWLHKRPAQGIWASLYSVPVYDSLAALLQTLPASWGEDRLDHLPVVTHALTHKDLYLHPLRVQVDDAAAVPGWAPAHGLADWFAPQDWGQLGLPAPVRSLLQARADAAESIGADEAV